MIAEGCSKGGVYIRNAMQLYYILGKKKRLDRERLSVDVYTFIVERCRPIIVERLSSVDLHKSCWPGFMTRCVP